MKKDSYVELNRIIRDCWSNVIDENVKCLRVSIMEFRASGKIRPSLGFRVDSLDVHNLYKKQHNSLMSFNNDLDLFYSQCLNESVPNEVVQFFHAQQLTSDEFRIFQNNFVQLLSSRFAWGNQRNQSRYRKTLAKLAFKYKNEEFNITDWKSGKIKAKHIFEHNVTRLQKRKKSVFDRSENQNFRLFIGYRATVELPLDQDIDPVWFDELIKSLERKLMHSKLWQWADIQTESEKMFKRRYKSFKGCLK